MCSESSAPSVNAVVSDPQISHDQDINDSTCSAPLDCSDLAEIVGTNKAVAVHLLKTLTPAQLTLQALAFAAYLNQLHGLDLDMEDILAGWQRGLGFGTR